MTSEGGLLCASVSPAPGRKRSWVARNGQRIVYPLQVAIREFSPLLERNLWELNAIVDVVDGVPQTISISLSTPDGTDHVFHERRIRWDAPRDIATWWVADRLENGSDPFVDEPSPALYLTLETRYELTPDFLRNIGRESIEIGRGYANALAHRYGTTPRTIRSWVEKGRREGVIPPAPRPGQAATGSDAPALQGRGSLPQRTK